MTLPMPSSLPLPTAPAARIAALEAAVLTLYDRQAELEKALAFEITQRRAFEEIVATLSHLQRRVLEMEGK